MFEKYYDSYAKVLISCAINLQKGQILYVEAPKEAIELVTRIEKYAYTLGARRVYIHLIDYDNMQNHEEFMELFILHINQKIKLLDESTAYLTLRPGLIDTKNIQLECFEKLNTMIQSEENCFRIARNSKGKYNCCKATVPTSYWAKQVYPDLSHSEAFIALWNAISQVSLCNKADPINAWQTRIQNIQKRIKSLNQIQFKSLHFFDNQSDFTIDLIQNHNWVGGCELTDDNIAYMPNFPTEEAFNAPIKTSLNGYIHSSKPLYYNNQYIEDIAFTFQNGKVIKATATHGDSHLKKLLATDEGSSYVGEIAILEGLTSIGKTNTVFRTTLLDENAACHFALGRSYLCNTNEANKTREELSMNDSRIHVDIMFGTPNINVIGITHDHKEIPILQNGNWTL